MAIEYQFYLDSTSNPEQLLDVVAQRASLSRTDELHAVRENELWVAASGELSRSAVSVKAAFAIEPRVLLWFRIDKFEGYERGMTPMFHIIGAVLQAQTGDAILLFGQESVVFLRVQGRWVINRPWIGTVRQGLDGAGLASEFESREFPDPYV